MVLFSLHNFVRSWLEHGYDLEVSFLGQKIRISARKSVFCYRIRFRQWPVCSPQQDGQFGTFGPIRFLITTVFVKKNRLTRQKSSSTPLWGHRLPVTALALLARRPFGLGFRPQKSSKIAQKTDHSIAIFFVFNR